MDLTNRATALEVIAPLSAAEQRTLAKAESVVAKGLKSFVEVGLALARIRDGRLYRAEYQTFAEYVAVRWDLSRPRAYELMAASDVVTGMSGIPDIGVLPANADQALPLVRLKKR